MAYRLYNEDVADGLTDFNDDKYHVLRVDKDRALIYNDQSEEFIVALNLRYHELNSIDWDQGSYSGDVLTATRIFEVATMDIRRFFLINPAPSNETLKVIFDTMIEAREQGNIPDMDLEGMFDMAISFIRDNPDIFDEGVIEEIEDTLA